ncbi:MAG TPA: HAD-IB family hydrolase [Ilumatobacteraceae bacterium]|nr:HAD-IB family hydrolase [Ilumatobacteraceae bacterium]HRB04481.1 HAD-IB family hydrolase [Ilumatobacteraceae bacterium]
MSERSSVDVAAFDVDGTLTIRDCVGPFLLRVGGWTGLTRAMLRKPVSALGAGVRRDRDSMKELLVGGVLRGRKVAQVEALGEEFAQHVEADWLRTDTLERLRWHQRAGHRIVLVSASLGPYLRPLGRRLGVDDVLCAEPLQVGDEFADGLDGANCRAQEKVRRLDAWLTDRRWEDATVWAYGDSAGDRELLARADHPLLVKGTLVSAVPAGFDRC